MGIGRPERWTASEAVRWSLGRWQWSRATSLSARYRPRRRESAQPLNDPHVLGEADPRQVEQVDAPLAGPVGDPTRVGRVVGAEEARAELARRRRGQGGVEGQPVWAG